MPLQTPESRLHHGPIVHTLAHRSIENHPEIKLFWDKFNKERIEQNLAVVTGISQEAKTYLGNSLASPQEKEMIQDFISIIINQQEIHKRYAPLLPSFPTAVSPYEALEAEIPSFQQGQKEEVNTPELVSSIEHILRETPEDLIFASDSHLTLYGQLEAVQNLGNKNIGVVVFDRHADIYLTTEHLEQALKNEENRHLGLCKANVLLFSLLSDVLKGVSVIGVSSEHRKEIIHGYGKNHPYKPTHDYVYQEFQNQISLADEATYSTWKNGHQSIDTQAFRKEVAKQVQFLKNAGAEHIVFSFDVDCLQTAKNGYTVMEYSPLSDELFFSLLDLTKLDQQADSQITPFQTLLKKISSFMDVWNTPREHPHLFLDILSDQEKENAAFLREASTSLNGLPLGLVHQAIDEVKLQAEKLDIEYGVRLPQGGRYLGDVTELSAPDYGNRMAKAIHAYTRRLVK